MFGFPISGQVKDLILLADGNMGALVNMKIFQNNL